jgi:hypothetical protein
MTSKSVILTLLRTLLVLLAVLLPLQSVAGTCFAIDDDTGVIITYDSDPPFNLRFNTTIQTSVIVTQSRSVLKLPILTPFPIGITSSFKARQMCLAMCAQMMVYLCR